MLLTIVNEVSYQNHHWIQQIKHYQNYYAKKIRTSWIYQMLMFVQLKSLHRFCSRFQQKNPANKNRYTAVLNEIRIWFLPFMITSFLLHRCSADEVVFEVLHGEADLQCLRCISLWQQFNSVSLQTVVTLTPALDAEGVLDAPLLHL